MHVIRNTDLPRAALPGIDHVTLAGSANGLESLSVWRQSVAPGAATPPHFHDCEEVVLIQAGTGELHVDGRTVTFDADTTLVLPARAMHQIVNTGAAPLELVGIFSDTPVGVYQQDGVPIELPWAS